MSDWIQSNDTINTNEKTPKPEYGRHYTALNFDGSIVAVNDGKTIHIFKKNETGWMEIGQPGIIRANPVENAGSTLALDDAGNRIVIGSPCSPQQGAVVQVYDYSSASNTWKQAGTVPLPDLNGSISCTSASINGKGNVIAVSVFGIRLNQTQVYQYNDSAASKWQQLGGSLDGGLASSLDNQRLTVAVQGNPMKSLRIYENIGEDWKKYHSENNPVIDVSPSDNVVHASVAFVNGIYRVDVLARSGYDCKSRANHCRIATRIFLSGSVKSSAREEPTIFGGFRKGDSKKMMPVVSISTKGIFTAIADPYNPSVRVQHIWVKSHGTNWYLPVNVTDAISNGLAMEMNSMGDTIAVTVNK